MCLCLDNRPGNGNLNGSDEGEDIPDVVRTHSVGVRLETLNPEGPSEGTTMPPTGHAALEGIAAGLLAKLNREQRLAVHRCGRD